MQRYKFPTTIYKTNEEGVIIKLGEKTIIKYKCLICGYEHEYDDTWTDEKKAEVQAEVDAHHNDHLNFENIL
jgi:hypothetical protein